jgi:IS30 family transposase
MRFSTGYRACRKHASCHGDPFFPAWNSQPGTSLNAARVKGKRGDVVGRAAVVLPGKRPIGDRPVEVELRQRIGRWEGDTVMGRDMRHCVLTLVERKTGYAIVSRSGRTVRRSTHLDRRNARVQD